jgi:hypothetical protein
MTEKQASQINKSFQVYTKELNIAKEKVDSLKKKALSHQDNFKKLRSTNSRTLKALELANTRYYELAKTRTNDVQILDKLDRNATLTGFSIAFALLILIVIQN